MEKKSKTKNLLSNTTKNLGREQKKIPNRKIKDQLITDIRFFSVHRSHEQEKIKKHSELYN